MLHGEIEEFPIALKLRLASGHSAPAPRVSGEDGIFRGGSPKIDVLHVGRERQPVVQVDGLLADPRSVVAFAARELEFGQGPSGSFFPGLRSRGAPSYVALFRTLLDRTLREAFSLPENCTFQFSNMFSMTTIPPAELDRTRQLPHVDSVGRRKLGVVHFLFDGELGGTSFYRHRATGWETIDEDREPRYLAIAQQEKTTIGYGSGYRVERSGLYDLLHETVPAMDRMVIFPGNLLHGAGVPDDAKLSPDPREGRLTLNSFIQLQ